MPEIRRSISSPAALWLCRYPETTDDFARRSRIFYAAQDPHGLFGSSARTTLWERAQRLAFRDQYRATFELPVRHGLPDLPEAPPTEWNDQMQEEAESGFRDWASENADRLALRHRKGRAFYQPDPTAQ